MITSPEKVLFDKIIINLGIVLRSQKSAMKYLTEDLRIDEESLKNRIQKLCDCGCPMLPKKESLLIVIRLIKSL